MPILSLCLFYPPFSACWSPVDEPVCHSDRYRDDTGGDCGGDGDGADSPA